MAGRNADRHALRSANLAGANGFLKAIRAFLRSAT
jgi:hypothetical protein